VESLLQLYFPADKG